MPKTNHPSVQIFQAAFFLCGIVNQVMAQIVESDPLHFLNQKAEGMPPARNNFISPFDRKEYTKREEYLSVVSPEYGTIVAGLHRVSYKGIFGKFHANCLGFEQYSRVTERAFIHKFYRSGVNYIAPGCNATGGYGSDVIRYSSEIYGLTENDCIDYMNNYLHRVIHCTNKLRPFELFINFFAGMLFGCILTLIILAVNFHHLSISINGRPLRLQGATNYPLFMRKLSGMNRQSRELSEFLNEIKTLFNELSDEQIEALEAKLPQIRCGITLGLPSQPVKLNETVYDLKQLLSLPEVNGIRRIPHMVDLGFTISEIRPANEEWEQIKSTVYELYPELNPQPEETTALIV